MQIPSDLKYVKPISTKIEKALTSRGLAESTILDIRLAIEEAVTNAVVHGNKLCRRLPVTIIYSLNEKKLEVTITDKGEGFDYRNISIPTEDENLTKPGGRGLFLIYHVMDKVHFNNKGSQIKMIKHLAKDS